MNWKIGYMLMSFVAMVMAFFSLLVPDDQVVGMLWLLFSSSLQLHSKLEP